MIRKHSVSIFSSLLILMFLLSACGTVSTDVSSLQAETSSASAETITEHESVATTQTVSEEITEDVQDSENQTASDPAETSPEETVEPVSETPASVISPDTVSPETTDSEEGYISMDTIPEYSGEPYVVINNNQPEFDASLLTTDSFEYYGDLDYLARCTACEANIGVDLMPTEDRGSISSVHPSGWIQAEYDCISGKDLYNRCHLIGYQLTGENANPNNLITGTRYLNIDGMLPFEDMVADYVKETGNHVLYRVTPIFQGDEFVARGVHMEGYSVEDDGDGICFNVYCYNVQPGIEIDYASGASQLCSEDSIYAIRDGITSSTTETNVESEDINDTESEPMSEPDAEITEDYDVSEDEAQDYVLNTNTMKFHYPSCSSVNRMKDTNREDVHCSRDELIAQGYDPCGNCNP